MTVTCSLREHFAKVTVTYHILTVEDLLAGRGIDMPPSAYGTFKQAEKVKKKDAAQENCCRNMRYLALRCGMTIALKVTWMCWSLSARPARGGYSIMPRCSRNYRPFFIAKWIWSAGEHCVKRGM